MTMDKNDNKGRDALAQVYKDKDGRAAINAERKREEATKGLPPMVCLGTLPNSHAAVYYATHKRETKEFRYKDLIQDHLRPLTSPEEWREFFKESAQTCDKDLFRMAKDCLQDAARDSKPYDPLRMRRGGLWEEVVDGEKGLIWNAGSECFFLPHEGGEKRKMRKVAHLQEAHVYDAGIVERACPADTPLSYEDGQKLQELFQARQWELACAAEIYLGEIVNGILSGVVEIRPNLYVVAPSKTGKSALRKDTRRALENVALHFVGTKTTEAAVRRDCDGNAQLVLNDEFVKNGTKEGKEAASARMETMRGSHDHEDGVVKLCGEGKEVRNYVLINSFMCYATAFPSDDPQDISRFFVLRLRPWADEDKRHELWEKQEAGREMVSRPGFHGELLARVMWEYPNIRQNMERLKKCLLGQKIEARRAEQLAHVLAGAYGVTQGGEMEDAAVAHALNVAREYVDSETDRNETESYLDVILSAVIEKGSNGHKNVRQLCGAIVERIDAGEKTRGFWAQETLKAYGMSWSKKYDCLMIKIPLEDSIAKLYEKHPQWANVSPERAVCAGTKEKPNELGLWKNGSANVGGKHCDALMVPRELILSTDEEEE